MRHEGIDFAIRHQVMNAAATLRFSAECSITISTQSEEALRNRGKGGMGEAVSRKVAGGICMMDQLF
jgi:hypothetical protein